MLHFLIPAASVLTLDRFFKHKIQKDRHRKRTVCLNQITFQYSRNYGAFLNLFEKHPRFLTVLSGILLFFLTIFFACICRKDRSPILLTAFGLFFSGASSNLYDRLTDGFVTDYISFRHPRCLSHIVYNLADFAIFLSCILITAKGV